MPIIEFKCRQCGETHERIFTISDVKDDMQSGCPNCHVPADRVLFSMPSEAHLYGNPDGYHKPSPTKRFSYKTVSQSTGNKHSAG